MIDKFENDLISNINFEGLFNGLVLENNYNDYSIMVYISKLLPNILEKNNIIESKEIINNDNIINNKFSKSSISTINAIKCLPLIKNNEIIIPDIGDNVTILFLDEDPKKAYYIPYNICNKITENNLIKEFKNNNKKFDCIYLKDNANILYNKTDKSLIFSVGTQKIEIFEDKILINNEKYNNNISD